MEKSNNCCEMARNNKCDICFQMQKSGICNACIKLYYEINKGKTDIRCVVFDLIAKNREPAIVILKSIKNSIEAYDCIATKKLTDRVTYVISKLIENPSSDLTSSDCSIIEMLLEELNVLVNWKVAIENEFI